VKGILVIMWHTWVDDIKMNVKGVGYAGVDIFNEISIYFSSELT